MLAQTSSLVGGIHGGYEWNGVLWLTNLWIILRPIEFIPKNLTVTIPSANPDGVYKVIGKEGHFSVTDIPAKEATVPGV